MHETQEETLKKYLGIRSDRDVLECILERFELPYMDALYRDSAGAIWLKWEDTNECFAGHMRRKLEEVTRERDELRRELEALRNTPAHTTEAVEEWFVRGFY